MGQSLAFITWIGATFLMAAFAMYAKSKGRSSSWALLAIIPVFGWLALAFLRDRAKRDGVAPRASVARGVAGVLLVALVGGSTCTCSMLPHIIVWEARSEAHRLVQPLDAHRERHGVYPNSLEELAAAQDPPVSLRAIHYETYDDAREFTLMCSSWDRRASYDSARASWRFSP